MRQKMKSAFVQKYLSEENARKYQHMLEKREEGKEQLEQALKRCAVTCYATEGIYPPDVEYMKEHYGIQIDEERYLVRYEIFAENLMPDITVVEKRDEKK